MSGIEALNKITERYAKVGKKVHLRHLSKDCIRLLENAEEIIDVNVIALYCFRINNNKENKKYQKLKKLSKDQFLQSYLFLLVQLF